jgi:NAD(P)-dependent dehydrogenase (short-subunit alcohol dehydrogenase family)
MRLEGKVALITGAARGQGEAEARLFAREGARVAIADVLEEEGERLEAEINELGGSAFFVRLDVTSESDWERAISATVQRFGKLDVLVNNAAVAVFVEPDDATVADWDRQMAINAKGVFLGTKAAIPEMRKAGGGSIVNISSTSGLIGQGYIHPGYNASKGAVRLLTKSIAIQYAKEGIRANSVHPGGTLTSMTEKRLSDPEAYAKGISLIPLGRFAQPEEIAYGVLYLASDESSYVTGSELVIDGGYTAQ